MRIRQARDDSDRFDATYGAVAAWRRGLALAAFYQRVFEDGPSNG